MSWFEPIVATRKREEISNLIKNLMEKFNVPPVAMPEIAFPTIDGQLVEPADFTDEHGEFEEEEMPEAVSLQKKRMSFSLPSNAYRNPSFSTGNAARARAR